MKGIFTISLDFELHWGVFDKRSIESRLTCYNNTLKLIPQMLQMFDEYNVHATWATVGSLFAKNESEWNSFKPLDEPVYVAEKYSAYKWVNTHGLQHADSFFAPELINTISSYKGQEIGTHTFSHYYCLEEVKHEAFAADLEAAKKAAAKFNIDIKSLVFPRNQFDKQALKTCFDKDIKVVRINPDIWFWKSISNEDTSIARKLFRTGDAYLSLSKRNSYPLSAVKQIANEPLQIAASRFLRPWSPRFDIMNKLSLKRVLSELTIAAKKQEVYHLWWHPENFGDHPEQNLERLQQILKRYTLCNERYEMTSWNMKEYADHFYKKITPVSNDKTVAV